MFQGGFDSHTAYFSQPKNSNPENQMAGLTQMLELKGINKQPNKALHPTAYSFALRFASLPAAGEFGRSAAARGLVACAIKRKLLPL